VSSFQRRILGALLAVLGVTALLIAALTRWLLEFHARQVDESGRETATVVEHLLGLVNRSLLIAVLVGAVVAVVTSVLLSRWLARPLERLAVAARQLGEGHFDVKVAPHHVTEMAEVAKAFNEMSAGLAGVERRRRELVANISHELRTPLTSIAGYLQGMLDGVFEPDEKVFASMLAETERLVRLVGDLQTLARAESADLPLRMARIQLPELLEPLVPLLHLDPLSPEHEIALRIDLPRDLPPLLVDPDWSRTVLLNLLKNAVQHTSPGGGITVSAIRQDPFILIRVSDTGSGITPEHLPHVFERFYRGDPSRAEGGTGIGLAVAKHIVERHGGSISVHSKPQAGTTFTLKLPAASDRAAASLDSPGSVGLGRSSRR
jgi:signal transduction histidine kinase